MLDGFDFSLPECFSDGLLAHVHLRIHVQRNIQVPELPQIILHTQRFVIIIGFYDHYIIGDALVYFVYLPVIFGSIK